MLKNFFSRLPKSTMPQKAAFSTQIVGANGRRLPLPDDKPLKEFDPEMASLLLKE